MINKIRNLLSGRGRIPDDPENDIPELASLRKIAFRMHPFTVSKTSLGSSKIGGQFISPINSNLPKCPDQNTDLINLLQLMGKDVEGWDNTAVLQIFWCPKDPAETYCPHLHVRWVKISDLGTVETASPAEAEENYLPKQCTIKIEKITKFPSIYELNEQLSRRVSEIKTWEKWGRKLFGPGYEGYSSHFYQNYLSTAPGWKVGG
jgi:hypothetical protein